MDSVSQVKNVSRLSKQVERFKHCHEEAVHPHLFQQITDIIFKKVLARKVSVQQQDEEQVVELTRAEEYALRYAAGSLQTII